jgi:hypothetical protein
MAMGEAKRRKQALGEKFGQVPPVLIPGSQQFALQIERFAKAFDERLDAIGLAPEERESVEDVDTELIDAEREKMAIFLTEYLAPYRPQDQQKLIEGYLDPIYRELLEVSEVIATESFEEMEDEGEIEIRQGFFLILMFATMAYGLLKPHMSEQNFALYREPLQMFYDLMLQDASGDEQSIAELQALFGTSLD